MSINYSRPDRGRPVNQGSQVPLQPPGGTPAPANAAPHTAPPHTGPPHAPALHAAAPAPPAAAQRRGPAPQADIDAAVAACPANVRQELTGPCLGALTLLREHLPATEEVRHLCSGAVTWMNSPVNSVFAVTSRRLVFVAPAPQVLSFDLRDVDKTQCTDNIFHLTAGDAKYQLGIAQGYGGHFERQVSFAVAVARLADG